MTHGYTVQFTIMLSGVQMVSKNNHIVSNLTRVIAIQFLKEIFREAEFTNLSDSLAIECNSTAYRARIEHFRILIRSSVSRRDKSLSQSNGHFDDFTAEPPSCDSSPKICFTRALRWIQCCLLFFAHFICQNYT